MTAGAPEPTSAREVAPTATLKRLTAAAARSLARVEELSRWESPWSGPALASAAVLELLLADSATARGRWLVAGHHYREREALLPKLPANAPARALFELQPSAFPWQRPCRTPGRVRVPIDVDRLLVSGRWSQLYRAARRQVDAAPRLVRGALYDVLAFTSLRLCQPRRASDWLVRRLSLDIPDGAKRYAWRYWLLSRSLVARGRLTEAREPLMSTIVLFHQARSPERSMLVLEYLLNVDEALGLTDLRDALAARIEGSESPRSEAASGWERSFLDVFEEREGGVH